MSNEIVIHTQQLTKVFQSKERGRVVAVDGLDLCVRRGEFYGLIGPDGSGKSTTIRLLAGLVWPSGGSAQVLSLAIDSKRQVRQLKARIGYMSQRASLYDDLTVKENLRLFARLQGIGWHGEADERIAGLLLFAGLEDAIDRLGSQLSGGMRQKLALICALIHEPEVLFLDEPTLGIDPVSRREFWGLLSRLRSDRGVTVFVCTSHMDEAERCERVAMLYLGRVLAEGTPGEIRGRLEAEVLDCRPSDSQAAQSLVVHLPGVIEVQTLGDRLRVLVDHASTRLPELASAMATRGIAVGEIRQVQPGLEEVFISFVQGQRQSLPQASLPPDSLRHGGDGE